jgi:hypothetical protein
MFNPSCHLVLRKRMEAASTFWQVVVGKVEAASCRFFQRQNDS